MKNIILTFLFLCPVIANAVPAALFQDYPGLTKVGESSRQVLFFDVYGIELYQDKYEPEVNLIHFTYEVNQTSQKRITQTLEDMQAQPSLSEAPFKAWGAQMKAYFPHVKEGDTISVLRTPYGSSRFYYNNRYHAEISDELYSNAFFGIWLGEESPYPSIKKDLLKKAFHK